MYIYKENYVKGIKKCGHTACYSFVLPQHLFMLPSSRLALPSFLLIYVHPTALTTNAAAAFAPLWLLLMLLSHVCTPHEMTERVMEYSRAMQAWWW